MDDKGDARLNVPQLEGEYMNQPDALKAPNYVTCPCQHCSGKIEFDANQIDVTGAAGNALTGQTIACPHCGLDTILFVPQQPKQESKPVADRKPAPSRLKIPNATKLPAKTIGFVTLGIFSLLILIYFENKTAMPASSSAIEIAEKFVLSGLKSPTTAKFSGASYEQRGTNVFLVSGYVDSQNSFGAMLRGTWLCLISNSPPDHWTCVVASVDGTPIISPEPPQNLELLSSQIVAFRDETSLQPEQHKYKTVKGVVKNISTHPLGQIVITYYLYNGEGNLAGSAKANDVRIGDPLKPGETWDFTTEAFNYELTPKLDTMESYQ